MANMFINAMTDLWNSAGTTYTAIKMNVTNAASSATSKLLDLQVGSASKFSVDKNGAVVAASSLTASGAITGTTGTFTTLQATGSSPLTITYADNGATGPVIGYFHDSASPAVSDAVALVRTYGRTSTAATVVYYDDYTYIIDPTNATATGGHIWRSLVNGVLTTHMTALASGMQIPAIGAITPGTGAFTTLGANGAVTFSSGGTLTGTFTGGTHTSASLTSPTITGSPTATGATWASLGTATTIDINGGTVDGTTIGASSRSTGLFTTLGANGAVTFSSGGTLTGTFTGGTFTGTTLTAPTLTLKQSAAPTPTDEGDIQWDTNGDFLVVGNGTAQTYFGSGPATAAISIGAPATTAEFTGIPVGARRITITGTITLAAASDDLILQLYDTTYSGAAYYGGVARIDGTETVTQTTGTGIILIETAGAGSTYYIKIDMYNNRNLIGYWYVTSSVFDDFNLIVNHSIGRGVTSANGSLTRVRFTTASGTLKLIGGDLELEWEF